MDIKKKGLHKVYLNADMEDDGDFIPLITDEDDEQLSEVDIPEKLPILPLRNTVLFPGVVLPINVGRDSSIQLIKEVYRKDKLIGALAQKDSHVDDPDFNDLYPVGTIAQIIKILEMPDGSTSVIIQGKSRFIIERQISNKPYLTAKVALLEDVKPKRKTKEFSALIESLKDLSLKIINLSSNIAPEASFAVKNIESPTFLVNFISSNSNFKSEDKQHLLEVDDLRKRSDELLELLVKEVQSLELKRDIQAKVKMDIDQQQREYMLHQQMKTIQDELGGNPIDQEIEALRNRAKKKKWGKEISDLFNKELEKLFRLNPSTGEYSVQVNYLQTLLDLPWNEYTKDRIDLKKAQRVLDKDHFGLDKVKDRILEHLAVLKLKGDLKSPIICLHGPPGVGKTSLGKSIATAIGRKFVRMSLGGLHDEAEIRGHRKTYIGAMPGRIVQNLKKVKSSNPVFILDEIDKVGRSHQGDPASALLEVLDPEQNDKFHDNYLETDYDLSKVMFIATANTTSTIHPALLDRMELIDVSGYILEEKIEIAARHLVPRELENHGVKAKQLKLSKKIIEHVVDNYTRESGVRQLNKVIAKIVRNVAKEIAIDESYSITLKQQDIENILGKPKFSRDKYQGNESAGVVTGLAWTSVGGEILFVETSLSRGKGSKLTLTGNLGDVMKESALLALEYLKSHADIFGLTPEVFEYWNVHIHVPEGAIPKDGPSAGVTMMTSLVSAFTQRKVKKGVAMTGEITLRGKVLPVGGIKEKILAAKRAGIKEIILCNENEKDILEIEDMYVKGLQFHYVDHVSQVLDIALLKQKVENPVHIGVPEMEKK